MSIKPSRRLRLDMDTLAFVLFCILAADCALMGSGKLLHLGTISLRMMLSAAIILLTLPKVLGNLHTLLRKPTVLCVFLFAIWCLIAAGIGFMRGNDQALLLTDLKGFSYFALLPGAVCLLRTEQRVRIVSLVVWSASLFLALLVSVLVAIHLANPLYMQQLGWQMLATGFGSFTYVSDTIPRLFPNSCMYLLTGFFLSTYLATRQRTVLRAIIFVLAGAMQIFALLFTYTRSLYGGCGVALLAFVVLMRLCAQVSYTKLLCALAASIAVVWIGVSLLGGAAHTGYIRYAFVRLGVLQETSVVVPENTVHLDGSQEKTDNATDSFTQQEQLEYFHALSENSDQIRRDTVRDLFKGIAQSPIWGSGFGAQIPSRTDGLNEYFYLDLAYKSGIVGVAIYLAALFVALWIVWHRRTGAYACLWLCALIGFAAFSFFMPYMNASLGIFTYVSTLAMIENTSQKRVATDAKKL